MAKTIPQQMAEAEAKRLKREKQGVKKPVRDYPWEQPGYPQYGQDGKPLHDHDTFNQENSGNGSRSHE